MKKRRNPTKERNDKNKLKKMFIIKGSKCRTNEKGEERKKIIITMINVQEPKRIKAKRERK